MAANSPMMPSTTTSPLQRPNSLGNTLLLSKGFETEDTCWTSWQSGTSHENSAVLFDYETHAVFLDGYLNLSPHNSGASAFRTPTPTATAVAAALAVESALDGTTSRLLDSSASDLSVCGSGRTTPIGVRTVSPHTSRCVSEDTAAQPKLPPHPPTPPHLLPKPRGTTQEDHPSQTSYSLRSSVASCASNVMESYSGLTQTAFGDSPSELTSLCLANSARRTHMDQGSNAVLHGATPTNLRMATGDVRPPSVEGSPAGGNALDSAIHQIVQQITDVTPPPPLPPPPSSFAELTERNVYISGIPTSFRTHNFRKICQRFGPIEASKLCEDSNGVPSKGYGFALFFHKESAAACIRGLNGCWMDGFLLQARYADTSATPKPLANEPTPTPHHNHNGRGSIRPETNHHFNIVSAPSNGIPPGVTLMWSLPPASTGATFMPLPGPHAGPTAAAPPTLLYAAPPNSPYTLASTIPPPPPPPPLPAPPAPQAHWQMFALSQQGPLQAANNAPPVNLSSSPPPCMWIPVNFSGHTTPQPQQQQAVMFPALHHPHNGAQALFVQPATGAQ